MSDWLLRRSYGFGAARVALCAEPHAAAGPDWTVREGLRQARASAGTWRDVGGLVPAIAMGLAIALAPLLALLQESLIAPDIDLVLLDSAAQTEPPIAKPAPRPPPVEVVVEREPPPPAAEPAPPEPPPVLAVARPTPPPPRPVAPPRIEPAPLAAPMPPASETIAQSRRRSRPTAPSAGAPTFQPAVVGIDALAKAEVAFAGSPTPERLSRSGGPRAEAADRTRPPPVRFDAGIPGVPALNESARSERPTRHEPPRDRRPQRSERPAGVALPAARAPEPAPRLAAAALVSLPGRPERPRDAAPEGSARASRPGLAGVALASLASCRSDAQEDGLKQRVLAEVAGRAECESSAGRYVFVETRNLNAFLMYVHRPPARSEADRCVELSLALDCLRRPGGPKAGRV
jgi:hypothetical protein